MAIPVLLDCDPGHDDALAILLAAASPASDLLGITTVAGNQTLAKTTLNARRVCTVAGITSVPISAGRAQPLHGRLRAAADSTARPAWTGLPSASPRSRSSRPARSSSCAR
jgi:purine nucleosidase/pyrimidine-specific ribonucleoside hydrolase